MARYVLRRALQSLYAVLMLLLIVFAMTRLTGDPTNQYLPLSASPQARADFAALHGFNDPYYVQFIRYVSDLAHGDFGQSLFKQRPAMEVALEAFPITLTLAFFTMSIALVLSIVLGSLAAMRPNGRFDRMISPLTIFTASAPTFWVALVAIFVFAMMLGWVPTSGMGTPAHWILPVCVLVLTPLGVLTQVVRSSMVSSLSAPYAKTALAKGASDARVVFVHALRNSLLPLITIAGVQATGLVNGAVVIETIFGFPGIGKVMIDSIRDRDFSLTIACILLAAVVVYAMNVAIDIMYARLDPRVQIGGEARR
ncbi:MAG TPA: ABC transporter permease [Kaistia sp.]|nr:ABC transporter permease [Kaistia sp.]